MTSEGRKRTTGEEWGGGECIGEAQKTLSSCAAEGQEREGEGFFGHRFLPPGSGRRREGGIEK